MRALCLPAARTFVAYGVRVRVRASSEALVAGVHAVLPPTVRPAAAVPAAFEVALRGSGRCPCGAHHPLAEAWLNGALFEQGGRLEPLLASIGAAMKVRVAEYAPRVTFVHAAVVSWRGVAIVIPAVSGAGKTTLTAELLRHGAIYCSDEFAVIGPDGLVRPYPQPLGMRAPGSAEQVGVAAAAFGARTARAPLPIAVVALIRFAKGRRWQVASLTPARAVLEILGHTVSTRRRPARTLGALEAACRGAVLLQGVRGDARDAAARLLALVERHAG